MKILLTGRIALVIFLLIAGMSAVSSNAWTETASPSVGAKIVPAETGFYYTIEEVYYETPFIVRGEDASVTGKSLVAVKVTVHGKGFKQKDTGPQIWLNGFFTMRARVSDDGASVEAYFTEPLNVLEQAAASTGAWELIYKSHEGVKAVQRISPTGNPADVNQIPKLGRLSSEEMTRVEILKQKFGLK
ncbi:MAG: hypothetical protein C4560_03925 [Nitrospiraceae bacterium]|nr:MAG: hypothetical protein C4560_03925 [Nitrospiraceae bacterium]